MPGSLTNYGEALFVNHVLGGEPIQVPPILYFGYMIGTPGESGPGSEPNLNSGYARVPAENNITNFPVTASQLKILEAEIIFPEALTNHGLVQAVGVFDSPAVGQGNLIAYTMLAAPVQINLGDSYRIPEGEFTIAFGPGGFSNYTKNGLLNMMFGNNAFDLPTTIYFGYSTSLPSDANPGTEPTVGGYTRIGKPNTVNLFPHAQDGTKTNAEEVAFAEATATQGSMIAIVMFDQLSGGNYLGRWELPNPRAIATGDEPTISPSTLNTLLD